MRRVAFLRGINVGGRTVRMAELRDVFCDAGFDGVTTVAQTGNVIFDSDAPTDFLKREIEARLRERFGFVVHVQIRGLEDLRRIVLDFPFDESDARLHSYVVFFEGDRERELLGEANGVDAQVEKVELGDGVIYWQVPKGSTLKSGFAKLLTGSRYRDYHTNRNISTLRTIIS